MPSPHSTAELWAVPAQDPVELRLAVIAQDVSLGSRAMAALIAEGVAVRLESAEREFSAADLLARHPHVLLLDARGNQRALEHHVRWVARRLPAAMVVIVLPSAFQGGELVVRHEGQEKVIAFSGNANAAI